MEHFFAFLLALGLAFLVYVVEATASYLIGLFGVPDWLLPYLRVFFGAVTVFVYALLVAPFVYKRRR